jgi:predicted porin
MNKTLITAALLTSVGTAVFAQSSSNVQIYGRINVTVERQKLITDDNETAMVNNASRFGLRGTEDLGGGLKAGFVLESGFNVATGAQSQTAFFARQTEVNLSGNFGMVRLGNFTSEAYYATADYVGLHNHDTGVSADALYAYIGRNTSKVAYRTPSFGGMTFEVGGTLRDGSPPPADRTYDLALNYDAGPLHLGAGYERNGDANQFALRALYEMGAFTFGGYVQRDKNGYASGNRTTLRLAGMYTAGASEFHVSLGRAGDYSDVSNTAATQAVLGYNYNLSKRTKLYGFYTKLSGDGGDGYALVNAGGVRNSFALGVRHNF